MRKRALVYISILTLLLVSCQPTAHRHARKAQKHDKKRLKHIAIAKELDPTIKLPDSVRTVTRIEIKSDTVTKTDTINGIVHVYKTIRDSVFINDTVYLKPEVDFSKLKSDRTRKQEEKTKRKDRKFDSKDKKQEEKTSRKNKKQDEKTQRANIRNSKIKFFSFGFGLAGLISLLLAFFLKKKQDQ